MKTILVLSILFFAIVLPARGELTDADFDKIRLIVKEEVKTEIAASEKRLMEHIDLKIETVNARIDGVEKSLNARIDAVDQKLSARIDAVDQKLSARIDALEGNISRIWLAILALIAAAVALPQLIIVYSERKRGERDPNVDSTTPGQRRSPTAVIIIASSLSRIILHVSRITFDSPTLHSAPINPR